MGKGSAGHSARRHGLKLRRQHTSDALKWGGWSALGGVAVATLVIREPSVGSLAGGTVAGVATAVWRFRRPGDWRRWLQGAAAEKRTGRHLRAVSSAGWAVLHDRAIPRSKANLDHVLAHPSGRFLVYVDTKAWHVRNARIYWDGRRLMYGRWNQTDKMRTVEWQASRLKDETGLPVVPVIAVDRGRVAGPNGARLINVDGTYVVSSDHLAGVLSQMDPLNGIDPVRVNRVRAEIERKFPAAQ